jgi:hypothetical protein
VGFHGTRRKQFNMTFIGIIALIVLVIAGLMVLRVKSDPREKESVREFLSEDKEKSETPPPPKNAS